MSAPAYESYKDSGVEWLGQVPSHWAVTSLRYLAECCDGQRIPLNAEQRSDRPGNVPYWGANSIMGYVDAALFDEELVLLGEDGAPFFDKTRQVSFYSQGPVWPNNHIHVLRPKSINGQYLTYALNATEYTQFIDGSTRDKLTQGAMLSIPIATPASHEQTAIAAFLDRETGKIDALIEAQTRLIELLKEKRQAVISHAVTKGLNPDAPMKDSGIEWLGQVPSHWNIVQLRHLLSRSFNGTTSTQVDEGPETVAVTRIETISKGHIDLSKVGYIPNGDALPSFKLEKGDILFSHINSLSMIGNCAIFNDEAQLYAGMNLLTLRPFNHVSPLWLNWVFKSPLTRSVVSAYAKPAINQASIPQSSLLGIHFPYPTLAEQNAIAAFLDRETGKIDALIEAQTRLIELLKERNQAIISAAVTGKIDVRGLVNIESEAA